MTISPEHKPNPYQAPSVADPPAEPILHFEPKLERTLGIFHSQILILGVFWVGCGILSLLANAGNSTPPHLDSDALELRTTLSVINGATGVLWLLFGALACTKRVWAVRAGAVVTAIQLAATIFQGFFCFPAAFLAAALFLACWVVRWSDELSAGGIPLTAKPRPIQFPLAD